MGVNLRFTLDTSGLDGIDVDGLITPDDLRLATETGLALQKKRISEDHKRADGTKLSAYSTKPISIPRSGIGTGNPMAKPKGGRTKRKNAAKVKKGQPRKPPSNYMRYDNGYEEFRQKTGRSTEKDFVLSGNTVHKRFRVQKVDGFKVIVGWPGGSLQGLVAAGLDAQEDGKAFAWSVEEQKAILDTLRTIIASRLRRRGGTGSENIVLEGTPIE